MLKLILSILVVLFFVIRDFLCWHYFPDMKTLSGDWNGANALTMNILHGIIGVTFAFSLLKTKHEITYFFQFAACWFSFFDLADRSVGIYVFTGIDKVFIIPSCIILASLTHIAYVRSIRKKTLNE